MIRKAAFYQPAIVLFVLCFIVLSCSDDDNNSSPTNNSAAIEANLQAVLDSIIDNTHVPGLVASISYPGKGVDFVYTAGVADLETNAPMDPDFYFRIGSNTKTFVITVLLQLVEEGQLSLEDKLSVFYPDFPRADEVTIEMLTNMRSGIKEYLATTEFDAALESNPMKVWTLEEIMNIASQYDYIFDPGTEWSYCNTNTQIIAGIIQQITGNTIGQEIGTRILQPLVLTKTIYPENNDLPSPHSKGYYAGTYTEDIIDMTSALDISAAGPAGCMISVPTELKTYAKALVGGTLLGQDMQDSRIQSCLPISDGSPLSYGYGIMEFGGYYGHNGGMPGFTSLMISNPQTNATIIIWYNCQLDGTTPTDIMAQIIEILNEE